MKFQLIQGMKIYIDVEAREKHTRPTMSRNLVGII